MAPVEGSITADAHQDPAVRRIVLRDARAVLGWEVVREVDGRFGAVVLREVDGRFGAVVLRGALRKVMTAGVVQRQPLRPLSLLLAGALNDGCLYVADAEEPAAASAEVASLVTALLSGLRVPQTASTSERIGSCLARRPRC